MFFPEMDSSKVLELSAQLRPSRFMKLDVGCCRTARGVLPLRHRRRRKNHDRRAGHGDEVSWHEPVRRPAARDDWWSGHRRSVSNASLEFHHARLMHFQRGLYLSYLVVKLRSYLYMYYFRRICLSSLKFVTRPFANGCVVRILYVIYS